jgi:hypothetical protein
MLEEREKAQLIDAMKIQVHEYISFIRDFTSRSNIMSKNFFIIIPYSGGLKISGGGSANPLAALFGQKPEKKKLNEDQERNFEEARIQLEQRVGLVEQGLGRCDLRTMRLGTEEITELFYKKFNPGELDSSVM